MFMTRSLNVVPNTGTTEQHLIVCRGKSEAYVDANYHRH